MPTRIATSIMPYNEESVALHRFDTSRASIDMIIIHTMDGSAQSAINLFASAPAAGRETSAHYGVRLDGSLIHWLEEYWTAYHAGNYPVNQRSIGIEHEDNGNYNDPIRTNAQYATSAKLVRDIAGFYGFPIDRTHIRKHSEVSQLGTACPDGLQIDRIVAEAQNPVGDCLVPNTPEWQAKFTELVRKSSLYDQLVAAGYSTPNDVLRQLQKYQQDENTLQQVRSLVK